MVRRTLKLLVGCLGTLSLGVATAHASPAHDAWLTAKTKIALITSNGVPVNAVHVDTNDGQVLLYGKVATQSQKNNAEAIAASIQGIVGVHDMLGVVASSQADIVALSDDHVRKQLEAELGGDACLGTAGIAVKSVDQGVVLLTGKARNLTIYLAALERASNVPGVRGVMSEVQAVDTLDNLDGARPDPSARCSALDSWITMDTKLRLIADSAVPALAIRVDTRAGDVTLFGIVPSAEAKDAAEADAKAIDEVRSVRNELSVVPNSKRESVDAKDEIVTRDVKMALNAEADFKHVGVSVKNGVARLTGKLPLGWQRLDAARLVRATAGVRSVDYELRP